MITIKKHVTFAGQVPACFHSLEQYEDWKVLARMAGANVAPRTGVCVDCTPEYQSEMIACGRCENPEVRFQWVNVKLNNRETCKELLGHLPSIKYQLKQKENDHV